MFAITLFAAFLTAQVSVTENGAGVNMVPSRAEASEDLVCVYSMFAKNMTKDKREYYG